MTKRKRRNHSRGFKAKVAMAAIRGDQTLAELAHSSLVQSYWPMLADTAAQMATSKYCCQAEYSLAIGAPPIGPPTAPGMGQMVSIARKIIHDPKVVSHIVLHVTNGYRTPEVKERYDFHSLEEAQDFAVIESCKHHEPERFSIYEQDMTFVETWQCGERLSIFQVV
jgi:hypothetical protein